MYSSILHTYIFIIIRNVQETKANEWASKWMRDFVISSVMFFLIFPIYISLLFICLAYLPCLLNDKMTLNSLWRNEGQLLLFVHLMINQIQSKQFFLFDSYSLSSHTIAYWTFERRVQIAHCDGTCYCYRSKNLWLKIIVFRY